MAPGLLQYPSIYYTPVHYRMHRLNMHIYIIACTCARYNVYVYVLKLQRLKNIMLFNDFNLEGLKTEYCSMISSPNVEKHNAFQRLFPQHLLLVGLLNLQPLVHSTAMQECHFSTRRWETAPGLLQQLQYPSIYCTPIHYSMHRLNMHIYIIACTCARYNVYVYVLQLKRLRTTIIQALMFKNKMLFNDFKLKC